MSTITISLFFLACLIHGSCFPQERKKDIEISSVKGRDSVKLSEAASSVQLHLESVRPHEHAGNHSAKSLATLMLSTNPGVKSNQKHVVTRSSRLTPKIHETPDVDGKVIIASRTVDERGTGYHAHDASRVKNLQMSDEKKPPSEDSEMDELEKRFTEIPQEEVTEEDKRKLIQGIGGFLIFVGLASCCIGGPIWESRQPDTSLIGNQPTPDDTPAFGYVPKPPPGYVPPAGEPGENQQ